MRVALIDVDGHNFPSLPLMKLSAWHKRKGDSVEWYDPLTAWADPPDRVYMSKVFTFYARLFASGMCWGNNKGRNWIYIPVWRGFVAERN